MTVFKSDKIGPFEVGRRVSTLLWKRIRAGWLVGGAAPQKAWNIGALVALELQRRLAPQVAFSVPVFVSWRKKSHVQVTIGNGSDEEAFEEIFVDGEYRAAQANDARVILDVGANVGYSAIYFALNYPNGTIYCFEPDPANYEKLCRNARQFKQIRCFQVALGDRDGETTLYVHRLRGMSSSLRPRPDFDSVPVKLVALDTFLHQEGIDHVDLLKFDIEGAEFDVFANLRSLDRVGAVIGEVHEDLMGATLEDFKSLLPGFNLVSRPFAPGRFLVYGHAGSGYEGDVVPKRPAGSPDLS